MKPQAVRRSPLFFTMRRWWRSPSPARALDLIGLGIALLTWWVIAFTLPELTR